MKEKIKLYKIKGNKKNPRIIKDKKFYDLVESIKGFPEMLEKRPIIVDEDMIVLGGNMRLKACKEAGLKEVWVDSAEGWTEEQKNEFIIKDNVSSGDWEWDMLGNEWNSSELESWGLDVWQNPDDVIDMVNKGDEYSEWVGMPEFESKEDAIKVVINFLNEKDRDEFVKKHELKLLSQKEGSRTWSANYPFRERQNLSSLSYE
jgi:hypothetical protein|tara:strand:+ start:1623 stop:2231 length:609 start_codon:yes stop_codon:yes gene_type:complete